MNRFIKKNLFLVGVLAISAAGILILLGLSAVKFFEMNKYQAETEKMTQALDDLNNRARTPIPPFKKNVKHVQEDTEGYKKLKHSIQDYFGQTLQPALIVFVQDLRIQSMDKLISLAEMVEKTDELAKLKQEFIAANKSWQASIADGDKSLADLNKAYKDLKRVENDEDTQAEKVKAVENQQKKIAAFKSKFDASLAAKNKTLKAARTAFSNVLAYLDSKFSNEQENTVYKNWAEKNKNEDKELKFYYNICRQDLTPETLHDTFAEYWNNVKGEQGPRQQTYRNFRLNRGATLDQPAEDKSKPVLWDADMWDNSIHEFVKEAQKTMLEKIDDKNREEVFLAAFGLLRNLDKNAALLENHAAKMNALVKEKLEEGNVFISGVTFGQTELELIKSNKGFSDTASSRTAADSNQSTNAGGGEGSTAATLLTAEPSDVIRNWDIIGDIAKYMIIANIDQLEKFSYVNLAGDGGNGNYKKYSYVITLVSRESQIRTFIELLSEAYKNNRMYVIKRFSMQKQEDQIQDIIDYASGIIGKDSQPANDKQAADESKNNQEKPAFFKESGNYPECVSGRSTICRVTLVIDYVEATGNQLK